MSWNQFYGTITSGTAQVIHLWRSSNELSKFFCQMDPKRRNHKGAYVFKSYEIQLLWTAELDTPSTKWEMIEPYRYQMRPRYLYNFKIAEHYCTTVFKIWMDHNITIIVNERQIPSPSFPRKWHLIFYEKRKGGHGNYDHTAIVWNVPGKKQVCSSILHRASFWF